MVHDAAAVNADDGITFELDSISIQVIRDDAEYPGLRMRTSVTLASWRGKVAWDISTGDPIVPAPQTVRIPREISEENLDDQMALVAAVLDPVFGR